MTRSLLRRTSAVVLTAITLTMPLVAQTFDTKKLLEDYSLQLFETNAQGFMSPLVIVTNVGANHGFYYSARMPKENVLSVSVSVHTMMAWVRDDQKAFTAKVPLTDRPGDDDFLLLFKSILRDAVRDGELEPDLQSATVFGDKGEFFRIPKDYILRRLPIIPPEVLNGLPDSISLTNGTNRDFVIAGVPQVQIGTWNSTDLLFRYIPPVTFDTAVGKFSFVGVALRHGISNWLDDSPVDVAVQASYQHSTIANTVGATRARLEATTDMLSVNVHASRRFGMLEPFIGVSFEHLTSKGSYTFTLPKAVVDQIGYDIDPQVARISLVDNAVKATIGASVVYQSLRAFVSAGLSKHIILHGGLAVTFDDLLRLP